MDNDRDREEEKEIGRVDEEVIGADDEVEDDEVEEDADEDADEQDVEE